MTLSDNNFEPGYFSRNTHLQTYFASSRLRLLGRNRMKEAAEKMLIDAGNQVRLLGYYSRHSGGRAKGTVTLLHGWEGSSESAYVLSAAKCLFLKGYNVFRLNLRDHGDSHDLNEGLFHGALIDEVFNAYLRITEMSPASPQFLMGFSLGGNFALRIALLQSKRRIQNLKRVVSISPALDPYKATVSIDTRYHIYRRYFLKKWKRSLIKKQALFPSMYDFGEVLKMDTCLAMTEAVMIYYPEFKDYRDYFNHYTLLGDIFKDLDVPVTIVSSEDDPVIPIEDLRELRKSDLLNVYIQKYGGHCGFFNAVPFDCWYESEIEQILLSEIS
ncbi:MAG: alpha/beta fold hydrolase [Candidatus Omnitrophica bacterium]|nr:alpha/beta fold hydrolase [Candidatus Omnitrophota bacterium]